MANNGIFSIPHIEASIRGLESARIKSGLGKGLFSATSFDSSKCKTSMTYGESLENDENYSLSWIRDTLKCSMYDLVAGNISNVKDTIHVLIDYFAHEQNKTIIAQVIDLRSKGEKLQFNQHAILPRMHPLTLEPVHADQQKDLQLDMAEILKNISLATRNGICILRNSSDIDLIKKLIKYLDCWDYSLAGEIPGDFGIWEEGKGGSTGILEPDIHSSSIAAILSGYMYIQDATLIAEDGSTEIVSINEDTINYGFKLLNERINNIGETEERQYDLTSLIILYDHLCLKEKLEKSLLTAENVKIILDNICKLERKNGFVRYASNDNLNYLDNYHRKGSPDGKSAEWTMGFCYAALIYDKLGLHDIAVSYIKKAENVFDWEKGLGLPEAYFGGTNKPVPISPLTWSNALYLTAYEIMRKRA